MSASLLPLGNWNTRNLVASLNAAHQQSDPRQQAIWDDAALEVAVDLVAEDGWPGSWVRWPNLNLNVGLPGQASTSGQLNADVYRAFSRYELTGTQTGQYPHIVFKTTEWMHNTKLTPLTTATTLGAAATYTTETQTIYAPETGERFFSSVRLVVWFRTEAAATTSVTGARASVQVGSQTFLIDQLLPAAGTANRNIVGEIDFDFTDHFKLNFGTGTNQTVTTTVAFSTSTSVNVNGLCFKWIVTYGFNPKATNTRIKTIRIPLQSAVAALTTAQLEFGTDGAGGVASGQIPALDTFLPEVTKTYRKIFLDLYSNDAGQAATNFTPQLSIDGGAATARATIDTTLETNQYWRDSFDLTGSITTNATHTVSMASDTVTSNRMEFMGGYLVVNYEYDHAATLANGIAIYEVFVPITQSAGNADQVANPYDAMASGNTQNNFQRQLAIVDIQEPAPITLVQSGVFQINEESSSTGVFMRRAGQQPQRTFTPFRASGGAVPVVHRVDANTGWTLQRGTNRLNWDIWGIGRTLQSSAFAIINYTAGINGDVDTGAHVCNWMQRAMDSSLSASTSVEASREAGGLKVPPLVAPYQIMGVFARILAYTASTLSSGYAIEHGVNEWDQGFSTTEGATPHIAVGSILPWDVPLTLFFNRNHLESGKVDITAKRRQLHVALLSFASSWSWWVSYYQTTFAVNGAVTVDGTAPAAGNTVQIWAYGGGVSSMAAQLVGTALTDGSGNFTFQTTDNTRTYFATYADAINGKFGRSPDGNPNVNTFNITIGNQNRAASPLGSLVVRSNL